jgi:hypothetical protein
MPMVRSACGLNTKQRAERRAMWMGMARRSGRAEEPVHPAFGRVEVRTIRRKVVHLDPGAMLGQPILNQAGAVHPQPVQSEEDLAAGVPDQALEEADQGRGVDRAVDDHPAQFALVGYRRWRLL